MSDSSALALKAQNAYAKAQSTIPGMSKSMNAAQARAKAQELEGVFLSQMLQPMFENLSPAKPFGGGPGDDIWRSMQVQEYGKAIAKGGGIGLSDAIYRQMIHTQEIR